MAGYDTVILGTTTLNVRSMRVRKVPATSKQKVGRVLIRIPIVGRNALDYEFDISGDVTGATLTAMETARDVIDAFNDTQKLINSTHTFTFKYNSNLRSCASKAWD